MPRDGVVGDALDQLAGVSVEEQNWVLSQLTMPEKREMSERWWRHGHPGQVAPKGDWRIWLILAGRGFGKTRAGAEWLSQAVQAWSGTIGA